MDDQQARAPCFRKGCRNRRRKRRHRRKSPLRPHRQTTARHPSGTPRCPRLPQRPPRQRGACIPHPRRSRRTTRQAAASRRPQCTRPCRSPNPAPHARTPFREPPHQAPTHPSVRPTRRRRSKSNRCTPENASQTRTLYAIWKQPSACLPLSCAKRLPRHIPEQPRKANLAGLRS